MGGMEGERREEGKEGVTDRSVGERVTGGRER